MKIYVVGGESEQSGVFGAFTKKGAALEFLDKISEHVGACIYEVELDKKWTDKEIRKQVDEEMEEETDEEEDEPKPKQKRSKNMALVGRYENHEAGHNKCWVLTKTKTGYEAVWGKCGGTMQGPKEYTQEEAEKVVKEKLRKGYELVA